MYEDYNKFYLAYYQLLKSGFWELNPLLLPISCVFIGVFIIKNVFNFWTSSNKLCETLQNETRINNIQTNRRTYPKMLYKSRNHLHITSISWGEIDFRGKVARASWLRPKLDLQLGMGRV